MSQLFTSHQANHPKGKKPVQNKKKVGRAEKM
jgi:hypothetical protein